MAFCPFYSLQCPGTTACAIWTEYGCCVIDKPGIAAVYNGGETPVKVFILEIRTDKAGINDPVLIIYCDRDTGVIGKSVTLSDFTIAIYH